MESLGIKMREVVITGASGFLGFALTKRLAELGIIVNAVIRSNSINVNKFEGLGNVKLIECNLDEMKRLTSLIPGCEVDAFYHFAWQGVSDKEAREEGIQLDNVKYACEAVKIAKELKAKKFIFASSIMEYEVVKLMETELAADKRNVYRVAKLTAHYLTRIIANDVGIEYNAANISNVFGIGEMSGRFINSTIRRMLKGERVQFTEAKQLYDFIYIDDAVEMLRLVGEKGQSNKSYYIGSMEPRVLRDYIYELKDCVDSTLELGIGENSDYIGVSLYYNEFEIDACKNDFQFKPKYTFKEGICKTVEWLKKMEITS